MTWDYSKLRGKIKEVCGTQDKLAAKIGIGKVSLSKRLNNQIDFEQEEIFKACDALGIEYADIPEYFFTEVV